MGVFGCAESIQTIPRCPTCPCTRVPRVPPTLAPRLPFSEDVLDIRLPLIRILDSVGVAVGGASCTRGTRAQGHVGHLGMVQMDSAPPKNPILTPHTLLQLRQGKSLILGVWQWVEHLVHVVHVYRDTWDTWGWSRWIQHTQKPPF